MGSKGRSRGRKAQAKTRATNRYGLARAIPATVKREVRQRCHFACVICGQLPYEYEHFDPAFKDARKHSPHGIALLCAKHHTEKTRGTLSLKTVKEWSKSPYSAKNDPVWTHTIGENPITLVMGGNKFGPNYNTGITSANEDIFRIRCEDGRWLISGTFRDVSGKETLKFVDDEVIANRESWDVTFEGMTMTVRSGHGDIVAEIKFDANQRLINVTGLEMQHQSLKLSATQDRLALENANNKNIVFKNCDGISIHDDPDGSLGIGGPVRRGDPR